jgi:transposase
LRRALQHLSALRTPDGEPIPPNTPAELQRNMARLRFIGDQIREIERVRLEELRSTPERRPHAMVQLVARIRGVGIETAEMLISEVLSRNSRDRRAVAR